LYIISGLRKLPFGGIFKCGHLEKPLGKTALSFNPEAVAV